MAFVLSQCNGGLLGAEPYLERGAACTDGEITVTKPPDEVKRLPRGLLARKAKRVFGHCRLDRRSYLRRRTEEAVRRRQALHRLVRPLEVVVLHEDRRSPLAVVEVGEHGAREELLPHRLPEALDLAAGLRVMRPALNVANAVAAKLLLEARLAAPGGVLAALVSEDLARCSIVGNAACQGLHHERAPLVVRHREAHQVARVVIEERRHIDALVLAQQEREEVRLPELVRLGTLEALLPWLSLCLRRGRRRCEPCAFQQAPHGRIRSANAKETLHHIANPTATRLRLLGLHRKHGFPSSVGLASRGYPQAARFGA
jgi:hypothetical protein